MEAKAVARDIRMSGKRAILVIDLVRGKKVSEAEAILKNQTQKAAPIIFKVLESAKANAVNNLGLNEEDLVVKEAYVGNGSTIKRIRMGSRANIDKNYHRTCHITIVVSDEK